MLDTKEMRTALARHGTSVLNEDEVLELLDRLEAAEQTAQDYLQIDGEKARIAQRLEAAEKECESWKGLSQQYGNEADGLRTHLSFAKDELNRLRAKIEAMEKQEPVKIQHRVPFLDSNGECVGYTAWKDGRGFDHWPHRSLYLAPGANCAPRITEG